LEVGKKAIILNFIYSKTGIAKHTFMVWMNTGALSEEKLLEVDKRMEKLLLPSDIGRLARKISKSYKCMKAGHWCIQCFHFGGF